ncbi:ANTAR domain-containing protein [Duganella sp. FT3S]|uniref:ANTAR domain-containing protein n=1 Tax=Rugamonas fusca TaxID=2758568 RepID=A0A7W2EJ86_9BURK|nr:ANTAR domain-containing protein [Rugamonas fusca]MBA5606839.1 ANTAR domain-containing protein [Rugamonas fusca]HJV01651.1 ANTAR domain-containing protein [Burkholderiaceae bacterium]
MRNLRIIIVNTVITAANAGDVAQRAQAARAQALREGLQEAGYDILASLPADMYLPDQIAQLQPDMIIIDAESDARDVLEHIVVATRDERRPIVLFTESEDEQSMEQAMRAGVSAYIVAGLKADRIKPVLNVALARFKQEQKLLTELNDTKHKLAERKVIERAKGLLMARHRLTEDQAYQKLRNMAMNKNLKLAEIAQRILDVEDLLG